MLANAEEEKKYVQHQAAPKKPKIQKSFLRIFFSSHPVYSVVPLALAPGRTRGINFSHLGLSSFRVHMIRNDILMQPNGETWIPPGSIQTGESPVRKSPEWPASCAGTPHARPARYRSNTPYVV